MTLDSTRLARDAPDKADNKVLQLRDAKSAGSSTRVTCISCPTLQSETYSARDAHRGYSKDTGTSAAKGRAAKQSMKSKKISIIERKSEHYD